MTAKEYLSQTYRIDRIIDSKLEQVGSLRELATKATATLTDVPTSGTRNFHRMEDVICKMMDLENEINADIETLIELKQEISQAIKSVDNANHRTLLELRYLSFQSWSQIVLTMRYSKQHVYRMHDEALKKICVPEKMRVKVFE